MSVKLAKGGNVNLTKGDPLLTTVTIALGWDPRTTDGTAYDLDASVIALGENGKALSERFFVYFGNQRTLGGSIVHSGDNLTGAGDGDDEQITIRLNEPELAAATRIVTVVNIYMADERGQNFGNVRNCFVRVLNTDTGAELVRYDLQEDFSTQTAVVFGELYRYDGNWKFRAVGEGYVNGMRAIATEYGIEIS